MVSQHPSLFSRGVARTQGLTRGLANDLLQAAAPALSSIIMFFSCYLFLPQALPPCPAHTAILWGQTLSGSLSSPVLLGQCQAHSKCSVNIYWMNEVLFLPGGEDPSTLQLELREPLFPVKGGVEGVPSHSCHEVPSRLASLSHALCEGFWELDRLSLK